ncbi:hypothetical protein HBH98_173090 [Parastagonospora nodorum]|nr:hypothetical protein HBH54_061790 [Parastagonospora nodorum]KAH4002048.1 hypothetical protein HBI10_078760 [Parastagonospora nodorum]KAH4039581.1 hypothetical protein HBI09_033820 [Parastagonospora nodorum]KAH4075594.1 hypothetical protein HBH50_018780 [Parastagonospora nodorum]KAH4108469.1 hypothetical protein HBH46_041790 [Parastagonospora nodorum]
MTTTKLCLLEPSLCHPLANRPRGSYLQFRPQRAFSSPSLSSLLLPAISSHTAQEYSKLARLHNTSLSEHSSPLKAQYPLTLPT